jgi:NAD(P)-dependent dehydrogenase (short-subunit alcohol dehydrogenase family)
LVGGVTIVRSFKDKSVLISGAGRGIGKRLALGFASAGARVGLLARSKAELDLAHLEIEHAGGAALKLLADVRDAAGIDAAVERMRSIFGAPAVLIGAHGVIGPIGPAEQTDAAVWTDAVVTQLAGSMNLCRAVIPGMREAHAGKIILLVGPGAISPRPRFSAYAACQAGLVRLVETLASELSESNIQVNAMNPGVTYTSLTDEILRAGELAGLNEMQSASQVRTSGGTLPDKQIQLAHFLASEHASHLTGRLISANDHWRKLEHTAMQSEVFASGRLHKV